MNGHTLLRLWFITYYISGILIPLMIIVGFIFNRFNIFNMIFSILACFFQFTMFLGLQLRDHKALFMYSTILLTIVHFSTLIYLLYMTQTLTNNIRHDLEKDIFSNRTELKYSLQIRIYQCCSLDNSLSDKTSSYFQRNYPNHCHKDKNKACWPAFQLMSFLTKIIYWLTWFFQSLLLILAWTYYHRLGKLHEQPAISPRKTLQQFYSEILQRNRPFKIFFQPTKHNQINTITNENNLKKATLFSSKDKH